MHDFWWNDNGWARCVCGEYLCVVGRQLDPVAAGVADWALDTHRTTLALRAMYAEEISAAVERTLLKFEELRDAALALGEGNMVDRVSEWCVLCPECHPGKVIADPCGKAHACAECAAQRMEQECRG